MSLVGNFPGLGALARRVIRAPINPLDRSTVISIYPKDIVEVKHTIQPGIFKIPKGSYKVPSITVIGPSSWWRELDDSQPLLEIPVSSVQVADSIVKDYCNGLLASNMSDSMPGIFFVPGEYDLTGILSKHRTELETAKNRQQNWFANLVKIGDTLWSRSNGNPLAISDDMRLAAQELGLKDKPWLQDFSTIELSNCPACGTLRNGLYPVCQTCRAIIDVKKATELGLKFAV